MDTHDLETKTRQVRDFVSKGHKVKVTCTFRGREMAHTEIGREVVMQLCDKVEDVAMVESEPKLMGKTLSLILAPGTRKKKESPKGVAKESGTTT